MDSENIRFSIIIPVYNRPDEVDELLGSIQLQTYTNFEVIIVEDGSTYPCDYIVDKYRSKMPILYYQKDNSGPGPTRNFGANHASGDYLIILDSDCVLPSLYLEVIAGELNKDLLDAFGGPDCAHESFSPTQKAINYAMTSFFTTGGIRGKKRGLDQFYPRSFNMGVRRTVYEKLHGFSAMRFGEDIDLSLRICERGYSCRLIPDAWVYHKRRTDFKKFFKQVFNSGIARINLYKRHPKSLKLVHLLPSIFTLGVVALCIMSLYTLFALLPIILYIFIVFIDSCVKNKSCHIGVLSVGAAFCQLIGYGMGFLIAAFRRLILRRNEFGAFEQNLYN